MTRRSRQGSRLRAASVVAIAAVAAAANCAPGSEAESPAPLRAASRAPEGRRVDYATASGSRHAILGIPKDADASDDELIDEGEYLVSYNARRRGPNWVAWRLEASDLGGARRSNQFRADQALPEGTGRVTPREYAHSGYDRGHLCPAADRGGSREANARTFLMTNMEPQVHELNIGPWKRLEEYERTRAKDPDTVLFIVAGGVFDAHPATIGRGIAIPRATFKVVVALRRGQGAGDVDASTPAMAVEMPNEAGVGTRAWDEFATSIDRVEMDTGYDFLDDVAPAVQDVIERRISRDL